VDHWHGAPIWDSQHLNMTITGTISFVLGCWFFHGGFIDVGWRR
jgi:hypothetical protein